jgi:hypothetical protein
MKVKEINVNALEWFDKINGNSYFASNVNVVFDNNDIKYFKLPFQYGYDSASLYQSLTLLINENIINTYNTSDLKEQGIKVNYSKKVNCKKSDLKNI